jgi:hypothetical protein
LKNDGFLRSVPGGVGGFDIPNVFDIDITDCVECVILEWLSQLLNVGIRRIVCVFVEGVERERGNT